MLYISSHLTSTGGPPVLYSLQCYISHLFLPPVLYSGAAASLQCLGEHHENSGDDDNCNNDDDDSDNGG